MTSVRRVDSVTLLGLHPHRQLLLLGAVLSALAVQVLIALTAHANALEILLFVLAVALLVLDSTGIGAHLSTVVTALGWTWAGTRGVDGPTLVVAMALLANHGCVTLAAHGHPRAPVAGRVAAAWGVRTAGIAALTALTWCAALAWSSRRLPRTGVFTVVALLLVTGAVLWVRAELTRTDTQE